jgi:hypothetical protein
MSTRYPVFHANHRSSLDQARIPWWPSRYRALQQWQPGDRGGERVNNKKIATAAAAEATRLQPPRNKKGIPAKRLTYLEKLEPVAKYSKPAVPEIQPDPAMAFNKPPTDNVFLAEEVLWELEAQPSAPVDKESGKRVKEWEYKQPLPYLHIGMDPNL